MTTNILTGIIGVEFNAGWVRIIDSVMQNSPVAEEALFVQMAKRKVRGDVTDIYLTEAQWNIVIDRLDDADNHRLGSYIWGNI
jgi:hypothetical protein